MKSWIRKLQDKKVVDELKFVKEQKSQMRFEMSFSLNSLEIFDIISLLKNDLGRTIKSWGLGVKIPLQRAELKISKMVKEDFFKTSQYFYDDRESVRLVIATVFPVIQPGVLRVMWIGELDEFNIASFKKLFKNKGFYSAFFYWELDEFYQNEDRLSEFKKKELPYNKLRVLETEWGYKGFSLNENPGRSRQICNMMLMSCFRMWFGPNSYELISKEKLENFSEGTVNKLVFDNIRFIELYEDPYSAFTKESRSVQKGFNEWIDIEGIYSYCLERFGSKLSVSDELKKWNEGQRHIE